MRVGGKFPNSLTSRNVLGSSGYPVYSNLCNSGIRYRPKVPNVLNYRWPTCRKVALKAFLGLWLRCVNMRKSYRSRTEVQWMETQGDVKWPVTVHAAAEASFQRSGHRGLQLTLSHPLMLWRWEQGSIAEEQVAGPRGERLVLFHRFSEPRVPEYRMKKATAQACLSAHKTLWFRCKTTLPREDLRTRKIKDKWRALQEPATRP